MKPSTELEGLARLCIAAGEAILSHAQAGLTVECKGDESPVTEADRAAEEIVLAGLRAAFPDIPVVAEEAAAAGEVPEISGKFFLVDPLDGTREFVAGRPDYTVNVALIEAGTPVMGVVHAPARGEIFAGDTRTARGDAGGGADAWAARVDEGRIGDWRRICVRRPVPAHPVAVASRSHRDEQIDGLLDRMAIGERVSIGSSLKFCMLAEGAADFYPRFGRTMEWDTAAGHAVLAAAGGLVTALDGTPFAYGKRRQAQDADFANPGFLAAATRALIDRAVAALAD
ncbi:3'(2'),5'-bisphosphate nucleotidase CysQ [Stappia sp.]|uniref:3'(2'),5'-bisphosphate nucleotidase CysQ n=1 Tax=Stappia sp. TaxID=1870903 RepID=UPI0032D8F006